MQRAMVLPGPADDELAAVVHSMMDDNWVPEGYAAPNPGIYPWQWLWDSCFHVLIWQALGEGGRAQRELAEVFRPQAPSGFVPHMNYVQAPVCCPGRASVWSGRQPHKIGHYT